MKNKMLKLNRPILAAIVLLMAPAVLAQSQNPKAMTWFKVGLTEKEPQAKIAAYLKAVEFDPQFVEALYNLGMTFKKQQDYGRAEQYLLQASQVKSDRQKNETRLQVQYELATTYKKLGKAQAAEEALRAAKKLAADPAMKTNIILELARTLYDAGQYQAALLELQSGRNEAGVKPESFNSLIRLAENEVEMLRLYEAAEKAQAGGNLRGAKALYEQVRAKNPAYREAGARIGALEAQLNAETQKSTVAALYDQALKQASEGNFESAIAGFENVLQQSGGNFKEAKTRLETARQQLALKQQNEKLENDYAAGLAALKARNWTRAILAFENVTASDRNYRDVRKRLTEAQNGLERESKETVVARYYADGIAAMNKNDFGGALAALEKVRRINANYRDVGALLAEVESVLQKRSAPDPTAAAPVTAAVAKLDSLYDAAVAAAERQDWMLAVINFEKVQLLQANYRDVLDRLAAARANAALVAKPENKETTAGKNLAFYLGSAVALITLPLLGFVAMSPVARARLHLMRGNFATATLIYEGLLARNPGKVKLYPVLANIYLQQGRSDENAMKVYKTILQLNLTTAYRDEINAIVAQKYLTEGRTDSDAIEILESALIAEQRRAKY